MRSANKPEGRHRSSALLSVAAGLLTGTMLLVGCDSLPRGGTAASEPAASQPGGGGDESAHELRWGVFLPDDGQPSSTYEHVVDVAGATPDYLMRFVALNERVPVDGIREDAARGATPIVSLEPWVPEAGTDQPAYALRSLAAGDHDVALHRWAQTLAGLETPIILRFAHEMNANWYPWAVGVNGNTADEFVQVWLRLARILDEHDAGNVQLFWAPNVAVEGVTTPISDTFPGADAVDLIGVSGYNWGDGEGHHWTEPGELFGSSLDELRELQTTAPLLISETGCAEDASETRRKAAWIDSLMRLAANQERLAGLVWFQMDKERDWRLDSRPESAEAFRRALGEHT
ncbi:glycoside hydrolase family 26 protein [Pseudoclavibacter sp. 13-3]|uniref:glycoside hydrolase family 26 protein n=1 Tax=Pseudoclavibacter sp. 13-3 TaxID=2901228 RepID=UPI001E361E58|nr:glycosyl hydrolase [Pseudoclavibacter sp. 13-3]MCD7102110.1 hypothetical protein [Pseudoclavibacter sp. 13-3]